MVHGSWFKLKDSVIIHKKKYFQKKCLESKMLSDLVSTSDVTFSGEDDDFKPYQNSFCMFGESCSKIHNNTLCNNTICKRHKRNLRHPSACRFFKIEMSVKVENIELG